MTKTNRLFLSILTALFALTCISLQAKDKDKNKEKDTQQVDQVRLFEQQWADAYVKADAAALEKLEADDFIFHDPMGQSLTKAQDIQSIKSGTVKFSELKMDDSNVRIYGKTAIITGIASVKGTYMAKPMDGKYRFIDVLVRKGTDWKAVSSQVTPIAAKK